ncbi:CD151 antigen-like [Copidosoma floridanum]|uniref:CD151 antigen-like n=1 Tax=Copidosoma floridanum TaxID=29053 RepID=UPI0006C99D2F|nr:CD151 antigen-like [Copidosoma floridanum]
MGYDTEMDGCGRFMKYSLFAVNFIIFISGVTLTGLAIYSLVEKVNYVSELTGNNLLTGTVYVLLVGGIIVSLISFFGCLGAAKEIKCFLFMYFIIILMLFVVILIGGILGYVFREKFVDTLQQQMRNSMHLYKEKREITEAWDYVQSKLHCCGVDSWQDWSRYLNEVPLSCCREMTEGKPIICNRYMDSVNQYNAYPWGCVEATKTFMQKHAAVLGGAGFVVAFLMFIGMIFSCALFKMI